MTDNIIYIDFKNKKRIYPSEEEIDALFEEPPKFADRKKAFLSLMDQGMVRTVVSARHPNVELPEGLPEEVSLNWSWKFSIPDFTVDDIGIRGTLSFQQKPFFVQIPWSAISAIWNLDKEESTKIQWDTSAE